jgi:hypothetical protein
MKRTIQILFFILAWTISASAQHLRGGDISSVNSSGVTYGFYVSTYTVDTIRNEIIIHYGDGTSEVMPRIEALLLGNIKYNRYYTSHTYAGPGFYNVSVEDSFRIVDIINIPNSSSTHMYLKEELNIDPFIGTNYSPAFTNFQTQIIYDSGIIIHDPGLLDNENDSLVCSLIPPIGIAGYTFPPATVSLSIDPTTGIVTWNEPVSMGTYNFCIKIEEWRNGIKIGSSMRDMCITIDSTTSIIDFGYKSDINLYPNPASDKIIIDLAFRQNLHLSVYNLVGDLVLRKELNNIKEEIDISNLVTGMYIIRVTGVDWTIQKKIIKE